MCSPEGFQPKKGARVWGYLTASDMHAATIKARQLYLMGAEFVLSDAPDVDLEDRPGWKLLSDPACLRDGDRLILSKQEDLSGDADEADAHIAELTARGVEVCILKQENFEGEDRQICESV
ncbi:MAG: hypothetical protein AAFV74_20005 [Pseudomonadota bacterium]